MIVDVVLRLSMRENLRGEALDTWLLAMERRIEGMELCETAQVVGNVKELSIRIVSLLEHYGIDVA